MSKYPRYQICEENSWSFDQVGSLRGHGQQGPGRGIEGCKRWDEMIMVGINVENKVYENS